MAMRAVLLAFGLMILTASAKPDTVAQCAPLEGAEPILSQKALHFLVIGEIHGTAETPTIFGDLVCLAAKGRNAVTIGLELPNTDQARLDQFIASEDLESARSRMLNSWSWAKGRDGRSSVAMIKLIERLRDFVRAGLVKRVIAFQPMGQLNEGQYEEAMAQHLLNAQKEGGGQMLVLVGNAHARLAENKWGRKSYWPMAHWLPKKQTATFFVSGNGGTAWNCQTDYTSSGGPSDLACAAHSINTPKKPNRREMKFSLKIQRRGFSGILSLGVEMTASPPVVQTLAQ
jgi:hypothetical protein